MHIKKECIEKIINRSKQDPMDLVHIIESFSSEPPRKEGASYKAACPLCGSSHSLIVTPGKGIFKCFACNDLSGKDPLSFLMKGKKMEYTEAVRWLADYFNILVDEEQPRQRSSAKPSKRSKEESFCKRMLTASGLTKEDVTASVIDGDNNLKAKRPTFVPGTIGSRGDIIKSGDDAIIYYYDLEGKPMQYVLESDKSATPRNYYRVRYQFPAEHTDKNGREMKYRSPAGAPTFIYIPQKIRALYQAKAEIPVLYIQEGEKKAEKACKHGIDSIAISGIQNLGYKGSLPEEIIKIVEVCHVQAVVFMLDGDCFDLSHHLAVDDPIDRRPKNFFYAVKNFKEYFNKLKNRQLYVEVYFGYLLKNEKGDKGVDDLLANTLKGHEEDLKADIERAKNEKQMTGRYVQLHKITTATDGKISEIWSLNNNREFALKYKEQLSVLPEFTIGKRRYKFNDEGDIESAQPVEPDEQFWSEKQKKDQPTEYRFDYTGCKNFLERRGFYRYRRADGEFDFIYLQTPVIRTVKYWEIGDYVRAFTKDCLNKNVLEMLLKGGNQYFGPVAISQMLEFYKPDFWKSVRGVQRFYFRDKWWSITANEIAVKDYADLHDNIWDEQKKSSVNPTPLPSLINITRTAEGNYEYTITKEGSRCHFLRFLENTSNFTWRKENPEESELTENAQHLVSKLCALGFLVVDGKNKAVSKAVVGMDGKQSDIGVSNGRSGKSLLGEAAKMVAVTRYYNGKELNSRNNSQFQWDGINEKTRIVFIDDAMKDFDFELLFGLITGDWPVNPKGSSPYIIPFERSPKIYLTTNHALSGVGSSFIDRQWLIAFSDFYNDSHKPVDDFGVLFFDEWDAEQWNLFWNLIAQSVQAYFRFGCVQAPGERLEQRKLRQDIGEEFLMWADEYFSAEENIDHELKRKDIYESLLNYVGAEKKKYYTAQSFRAKLEFYCRFRGYYLNPDCYDPVNKQYRSYDKDGRPITYIKRNGVEYITVGSPDYYETHRLPDMFGDIPADNVQETLIDTALNDMDTDILDAMI